MNTTILLLIYYTFEIIGKIVGKDLKMLRHHFILMLFIRIFYAFGYTLFQINEFRYMINDNFASVISILLGILLSLTNGVSISILLIDITDEIEGRYMGRSSSIANFTSLTGMFMGTLFSTFIMKKFVI